MLGRVYCNYNIIIHSYVAIPYSCCKSFEVEKFRRFCRSIGKHETFAVKHFCFDNRALKNGRSQSRAFFKRIIVIYSPLLGKVSEIMPPLPNYGIHGSNVPDKIIIEHNFVYGQLQLVSCIFYSAIQPPSNDGYPTIFINMIPMYLH